MALGIPSDNSRVIQSGEHLLLPNGTVFIAWPLITILKNGGNHAFGPNERGFPQKKFYDGEAHFTLDNPDEAIRAAAEHGGEGFEQFMVIWEGEKTRDILSKRRCWRIMAELNGRVCVIESRAIMEYPDFISKVQKLGVKTAIYLDMGAHSSYSKYRRNDGQVINLFGKRGEFAHTWVAFYKGN